MKLRNDERAMLEGKEGKARQKAMQFLVKYGEALGAKEFVDTNNVCFSVSTKSLTEKYNNFDALFSQFNLDSDETLEIPMAKAFSCHLEQRMDPEHWDLLGFSEDEYREHMESERFCDKIGMQLMCTCTPYLTGNVPARGEHCAWMESSAVIYINSVLGARTNVEGSESTGAAMLTGKIPNWGYHLQENRLGTHIVEVESDVESFRDWGILGYYVGQVVKDKVPVINGINKVPGLEKLKHFGAAAASSGGIEMYHIPEITAEARTVKEAFGGREPVGSFKFGEKEKKEVYEEINCSGKDRQVDFVMLGCPHASIKEIWEACKLLEGKKVHENTSFWIFTPRAIKAIAERNGYKKIINDAGGFLVCDSCPALGHFLPAGTKVAATNSAKQTHYLPSHFDVQSWFGTTEECIDAAITGEWRGEL